MLIVKDEDRIHVGLITEFADIFVSVSVFPIPFSPVRLMPLL